MAFWFSVVKIVKECDVAVIVLDARMPDISMNPELLNLLIKSGKPFIRVYNKIDLLSKEALEDLKKEHRDSMFVSGNKNIGIKDLKRRLLILGKKTGKNTPKVGLFGYPNVGKSAIINCLAYRAKAKTSPVAGTTKGPQFIKAGSLKIIDSPGVVPYGEKEVRLGVLSAKNPEKLKNAGRTAIEIIRMLKETNSKAFESFYKVKFSDYEEDYDLLLAIGKRKGCLKKGGEVDERRTEIQIIRDWQRGRIKDL